MKTLLSNLRKQNQQNFIDCSVTAVITCYLKLNSLLITHWCSNESAISATSDGINFLLVSWLTGLSVSSLVTKKSILNFSSLALFTFPFNWLNYLVRSLFDCGIVSKTLSTFICQLLMVMISNVPNPHLSTFFFQDNVWDCTICSWRFKLFTLRVSFQIKLSQMAY